MSIIEHVGEFSENNATIAENQQKVYEAGVRAGLAQDPDYAEGYQDGLDSAAGVEWESLLDGRTPVGRAKEADHATEASHSVTADSATTASRAAAADQATNANRAANADHAANADYATNAGHATTATAATNATNAAHANNADNATHADTARALEVVLPVENGGTGASTKEGAWENLGLSNVAHIETGSYVGLGGSVYVFNEVNTITFKNIIPQFVVIVPVGASDPVSLTLIRGMKSVPVLTKKKRETNTMYEYMPDIDSVSVTWADKSITITESDHEKRMDKEGQTYYYFGFGSPALDDKEE